MFDYCIVAGYYNGTASSSWSYICGISVELWTQTSSDKDGNISTTRK